jgi:hypothetical protein
MKSVKYLFLMGALLLPLGIATAQNGDWRDREHRSGRLDDIARDLANRADAVWSMVQNRNARDEDRNDLYTAFRNFDRNTRNFASRVDASNSDTYRAGAEQLVREAENIGRLVDRFQNMYRIQDQWNDVEVQVDRLSRFYGISYSGSHNLARTDPYRSNGGYGGYGRDRDRDRDYSGSGAYGNYGGGYQSGVFRWRGRVDGSDYIYLRGSRVDIRHLQAQPIVNSTYDLPSPLPRTPVNVQLRRLRGRGRVQLVQQPTAQNGYTAGILIEDNDAGADDYEFELSW